MSRTAPDVRELVPQSPPANALSHSQYCSGIGRSSPSRAVSRGTRVGAGWLGTGAAGERGGAMAGNGMRGELMAELPLAADGMAVELKESDSVGSGNVVISVQRPIWKSPVGPRLPKRSAAVVLVMVA